MVRVRRPTARVSPPGPCCIPTVDASQASRRAVSAEMWMPPASSSTVWRRPAGVDAARRGPGQGVGPGRDGAPRSSRRTATARASWPSPRRTGTSVVVSRVPAGPRSGRRVLALRMLPRGFPRKRVRRRAALIPTRPSPTFPRERRALRSGPRRPRAPPPDTGRSPFPGRARPTTRTPQSPPAHPPAVAPAPAPPPLRRGRPSCPRPPPSRRRRGPGRRRPRAPAARPRPPQATDGPAPPPSRSRPPTSAATALRAAAGPRPAPPSGPPAARPARSTTFSPRRATRWC